MYLSISVSSCVMRYSCLNILIDTDFGLSVQAGTSTLARRRSAFVSCCFLSFPYRFLLIAEASQYAVNSRSYIRKYVFCRAYPYGKPEWCILLFIACCAVPEKPEALIVQEMENSPLSASSSSVCVAYETLYYLALIDVFTGSVITLLISVTVPSASVEKRLATRLPSGVL